VKSLKFRVGTRSGGQNYKTRETLIKMVRQCDAFTSVKYQTLKTQYLLTYSMEHSPS